MKKIFTPGQKVYHKGRQEYGIFFCYDELSTEINDTCWVEIDGEDQHVSVDQIEAAE